MSSEEDHIERKELMFNPDCRRFTEFFSTSTLNELWSCLGEFIDDNSAEFNVSEEVYSITTKILRTEGKSIPKSLLI